MTTVACPYGTHRVVEPQGALPQSAWKIDNTMEIYDNELLIDVDTLNIDAASFTQIKKQAEGNPETMKQIILDIVAKRGKHHNPVTGSGGMLMGTVSKIGSSWEGKTPVKEGDRIATLVSLSLTPLKIGKIRKIHLDREQVEVEAQAVLFSSGIYAVLPQGYVAVARAGGAGCGRRACSDCPSCASGSNGTGYWWRAANPACCACMRRKSGLASPAK